ncbi:putative copper-importing P-type ATPase A [wastewater metagenome]|uniref:Putative copper-importing P-type ATPase A n=2 Tax=unclassified sequences TaxID=12908 RepID=A0A5B8RI15_9ZZZZ|nr:heavy metal translocating P-type ATPase [Arhodomonas sp. KWT]QEA07282.1 putative copper-importing P-type ATPase A [uncultured organism]
MAERCFHCGDPVPTGERRVVRIDGEDRPVCCAGCEAVARLIAGSGLSDFYRYRTAPSSRPEPEADEWSAYDRETLLDEVSHPVGEHAREAVFALEGITCAACAWLIERVLEREPGVETVQVNPATGRLLLGWDTTVTPLSTLLRHLAGIGYRAHPLEAGEAVPGIIRERRAMLRRLAVAGLGMMQVMMYAVGLYAGAIHNDMDPQIETFLRLVSLLVATPVVVYAGAPFFRGAWRDVRGGRPGMDVPVALAVGSAFAASVWNTLVAGGEVYFDSATMFVFFLTVARSLEMVARHRAGRTTESLAQTLPTTALRLSGERPERVALRELQPGDRVRVRPGDTIPADGTVISGRSAVDESLITGEFEPVPRGEGDAVLAGSGNTGGALDIRVERIGRQTLVSAIVGLLERAQTRRPRLARVADRVAGWFVSAVLAGTVVIAGVWWWLEPGAAFEITLAVLVATCPCALSLATPTALVASTSALARRGLLVTRTDAVEGLARASRLILDKTGTLTTGTPGVRGIRVAERIGRDEAYALAAALEAHSEHPIAGAFPPGENLPRAGEVTVEPGSGLAGDVNGRAVRLGRPEWALPAGVTAPAGGIVLADGDGWLATFELADQLRPEAVPAIQALQARGLTVEIASGDDPASVAEVAAAVGVDGWRARMRPEDKLARMREVQSAGERVVMVGDGINDAPVLAGADVSVAMGRGSALARNSADMVLMRDDLSALVEAADGARRAVRIIRENLIWAALYNLTALPLAATGMLTPWMAAIGMSLSSLVVVGNALRANRWRAPRLGPGGHEPAAITTATP